MDIMFMGILVVWKFWCELIIDEYNFYVWIFYESVDMN